MAGDRSGTGMQDAQLRFCDEYLVDFNGTAAYQRAGYKPRSNAVAKAASSRLLSTPKVQAYLATRKRALLQRTEFDAETTLKRLAYLALSDIRPLFDERGGLRPVHELSADEASLIQGLEIMEVHQGSGDAREFVGHLKKVKLVNRLDALKALGTHFGMFVQQHKHEHKVEGLQGILSEIDGADTGPGRSKSRSDHRASK